MSKREKLIKKLQEVPTPKDIAWDTVKSLLEYYGAEVVGGKGSHVVVEINGERETLVAKSPMKPYLVKKVVELLRRAGAI